MCTVSYVPTSGGFILTSNRDEKLGRNTSHQPTYTNVNGTKILCPKDDLSKGTWIATDGSNFTLCLFNGAYQNHTPAPPYKESRGNIIPQFFSFSQVLSFVTRYEFAGIEPFSLVIVQHSPTFLWLFIWDGENSNLQNLDEHEKQLWSSVTLYEREIHQRKQHAFYKKIKKQNSVDLKKIVKLHKETEIGDEENNFIMRRSKCGMQTLSISSIEVNRDETLFYHENLLDNTISFIKFA